jgi:hypothetical protein
MCVHFEPGQQFIIGVVEMHPVARSLSCQSILAVGASAIFVAPNDPGSKARGNLCRIVSAAIIINPDFVERPGLCRDAPKKPRKKRGGVVSRNEKS